jgi:hypothetical protein
MNLWISWWRLIKELRPCFSRQQTFFWFVLVAMCVTIRIDLAGATSLIRALGLDEFYYDRILDFFHSTGIDLQSLKRVWTKLVIKTGLAVKVGDRIILVGDGVKIPKEGRKMPGVKSLHQESESNSKAEFIMGHSFQAIALLTSSMGYFFATPLATEIHEGVVESNRDTRTLLGKMATLVQSLALAVPAYFLGDAYYAKQTLILPLLKSGVHIITRVSKSAVAFFPPPTNTKCRRGRPRIYGRKIKLMDVFKDTAAFTAGTGSIYNEDLAQFRYHSIDLLWRPIGILVRFVFVIHPNRGKAIFLSTNLIDPMEIIKIYSLRYKIEVTFKQALHSIGTFTYHFWMRGMTRIKRCSGDQYLHRKTDEYRQQVKRKLKAYHVYTQIGLIVQGVLQVIAMTIHKDVWLCFGSWIRTIRPNVLPSEAVVMKALRNTVSEFLASDQIDPSIAKFIIEKIDFTRSEGLRMLG